MCCAWFPDSERFVSGSVDRTLALLDTQGGWRGAAAGCEGAGGDARWEGAGAGRVPTTVAACASRATLCSNANRVNAGTRSQPEVSQARAILTSQAEYESVVRYAAMCLPQVVRSRGSSDLTVFKTWPSTLAGQSSS